MAKIGMRIQLTTLSDEAASMAPIRPINTSFMYNSAFIAPKTPVFGLYSTLIARVIRRLLHQTQRIPTLIAPSRLTILDEDSLKASR
jgi:hypothetical protein